jgi:hypothetical protein
MKRVLLISLAALSLTACATAPTVYGPALGPRAVGFSEYRIQDNRYRVIFQGGGGAPRAQVDDYALLRAAEVTTRDGYDWFRVIAREGEVTPGSGPQISIGGGSMDFGRRSSVGIGVGTAFDLSGGPRLTVTLEVMLGKGARPQDAYDARDVIQSIGRGGPRQAPQQGGASI